MYVLEGRTSFGWHTIRYLPTINDIVAAMKRYHGDQRWRVVPQSRHNAAITLR